MGIRWENDEAFEKKIQTLPKCLMFSPIYTERQASINAMYQTVQHSDRWEYSKAQQTKNQHGFVDCRIEMTEFYQKWVMFGLTHMQISTFGVYLLC